MTAASPLLERWRRVCTQHPDAPAVMNADTGQVWTRVELDQLARARAATLPTDVARRRVLFCCANGAEWMARFLALLESDAVPVPVDPTEPLARQLELAASIGADVWTDTRVQAAPRRIRDADAALIKLTSGSTARPRALRFRAQELIADAEQVARTMGIGPDDLNLALIPCGHSYGLGNVALPLPVQGTGFVVPASALPSDIAACCEQWRPTVFPAVPAVLRLMIESGIEPASLGSLRTIISAGSVLHPETAQRFMRTFGRQVHGFYGSSETGGISYDRTGDATLSGRSVGTPMDGVRIEPRPGGRLLIESPAVYTLGNPRNRSTGLGRHMPGDIGRIDERGEVVLTGRVGRTVKLAGRRVNLGELEKSLLAIEGVTQAYVIVHPTRADELAAAVATRESTAALRQRLAAQWPAWRIPRRLVVISEFPLTARGKVDTAALRRALGAG